MTLREHSTQHGVGKGQASSVVVVHAPDAVRGLQAVKQKAQEVIELLDALGGRRGLR